MTNYEKGSNRERYIKKKLEKAGYLVVRSAGSHSPIDLIAIDREGSLLFLQVKPKKFSNNKAIQLEQEYSWLDRLFKGKFRVISSWDNKTQEVKNGRDNNS